MYCLEPDAKIESRQNAVLRSIEVSQELSAYSTYIDLVSASP
jgi:hypothetical protein